MTMTPSSAGAMATSVSAPTTAPQPSITAGLLVTDLMLVIMAVMKSMSLSMSSGMAITVRENRMLASTAPLTLPTAMKSQPSGVEKTDDGRQALERLRRLVLQEDGEPQPHLVGPHPEHEQHDQRHPAELAALLVEDDEQDIARGERLAASQTA